MAYSHCRTRVQPVRRLHGDNLLTPDPIVIVKKRTPPEVGASPMEITHLGSGIF